MDALAVSSVDVSMVGSPKDELSLQVAEKKKERSRRRSLSVNCTVVFEKRKGHSSETYQSEILLLDPNVAAVMVGYPRIKEDGGR